MNKKKVVKPKKKAPVKKEPIKLQTQTQKQVVYVNIGDKGTKSQVKRKVSSKPSKKELLKPSFLPSGPTIIMNPNVPQAPQQPYPQQPMGRGPPPNTINPATPTYIPEYVSVDYLDDSERIIEPFRQARLQRFLNEPLSRVSEVGSISNISDLTSESYYPPPVPPNSIGSDYYLRPPASSVIPDLFAIQPPQTPIGSVASSSTSILTPDSVSLSSKKSEKYAEYPDIYPEKEGASGIDNPFQSVIQLTERDLLGEVENIPEINPPVRGDRFETARIIRQINQLAENAGADISLEDLLDKKYGFTTSGNRRTAPTIEQRQRLFEAGRPYRGDEYGVVGGRKSKK